MIAIFSLLLVIALSLLIVRIGTIALTMTGLTEEVARFQALSAFSGAGFTTDEAEQVVAGPARRRIIGLLIRLGSVGFVTAISTLMLSLIGAERAATMDRLLVLLAGIVIIFAVARSRRLERIATPIIRNALQRSADFDLQDYAHVLRLRENYGVGRIKVTEDSLWAGKTLEELNLPSRSMNVLGVEHNDGTYEGVPDGDTVIEAGDRVVLYGQRDQLNRLE
ncbi:TrkA C-terminal domain-containing protein [Marinovum algicola]|uniref:TrkA C-terminal domain-containing protein n=1 Tax=Alphaproteobacteria TaxID=28211 RepID=UPI0032ED21E6